MVCILVYFKLHCAHLVFTKADIKSQFQLTNYLFCRYSFQGIINCFFVKALE